MTTPTARAPLTTPTQVADLLITRLDDSYDLIYIDRGDQLTDEQVAALVAGDTEKLWESFESFESQNRWHGVKYVIGELVSDLRREYDGDDSALEAIDEFDEQGDEWDQVRFAIEERDSGDWFTDLVRATPDVLLRIAADGLGEDDSFSFREVTPQEVLDAVGFEHTEHNVTQVQYALDNASPEFSVIMGYWIVGADLGEINEVHKSGAKQVTITDPHLHLGNPFSGSGFMTEEALTGTITVATEDLRTDKSAFGWPLEEVYGGLSASDFSATITPVPTTEELTA